MRKYLAIKLCKLGKKIGSYFGRGSSMPGKLALTVCPDVLRKVKLPEYTIAVSGSNGKTSTVEMIHEILESNGLSVAYNYEGSNQIEGVTTLILDNCNNKGEFEKDVLLMEVDERYAKYIFKYFSPRFYIINNLYRDQMTRNGHPEYVMNDIKKSIQPDSTLILNSDDPLIASLAEEFDNEVVYFGIGDNQYVSEDCNSIYNDGYYCPICKHKMIYDYYQFAHVGKYRCSSCDFERPKPEYEISEYDKDNKEIVINKRYRISLAQNSLHNAYNVLSAFALGSLMGLKKKKIAESLNDYLITNGRIKSFSYQGKEGTLLISKHENSISYNNNIQYIIDQHKDYSILLIIDDISRKYFTADTSWLWDINFELLNNKNLKQLVVAGKYTDDSAVRLEYAGIDKDKIFLFRHTKDALDYLKSDNSCLYVLTCFSDEGKLLKEVTLL